MRTHHVYLYAVIPRTHDGDYIPRGILDLPVSLCSQGDLSAAISLVPTDAEPDDPPAHERVMKRLLRHSSVLPAPVPTILSSASALHELLAQKQQLMRGELQRLEGLIEVRLHVTARRAEAAPPAETAERDYLLARLSTALRSSGFCSRQLPSRHPENMLRLACLLHAAFLEPFMLTCESLKRNLGPARELLVSGPMAPVDFISRSVFSGLEIHQASSAGAARAA